MRQKLTSSEKWLCLGHILTTTTHPLRGYACAYMHSSYTGGMHTLRMRWRTYTVLPERMWTRAFRPAYGRE